MSEKDRLESIPVLNQVEDGWDIVSSLWTDKSVKDAVKENIPDLIAGGIDAATGNFSGEQDSGNTLGASAGRMLGATFNGGTDGLKAQAKAEAVGFIPGAIEGLGVAAATYTGVTELADLGKVAGGAVDSMLPDMPGYQGQKPGGPIVGTASAGLSDSASGDPAVRLRDYSQDERAAARSGADYVTARTLAYETIKNTLGLGSHKQVDLVIDAIHFLTEDRFDKDL